MNPFSPQAAAQVLVSRRCNGSQGERLPEACRPSNIEEALAIQEAVSRLWCDQQDDTIGGWKCGLPSPDKVVVAPIYTRTIDSIPPISLWPTGAQARVEPELAFFFGADLPARSAPYTPADIDAAISRTHLALELIHSRFLQPKENGFPEQLADGLVNQGLFIGPAVDISPSTDCEHIAIDVTYAGQHQVLAGQHPSGNPRAPLYWLVEYLRSRGQGILAGQAVITGSYAGVIELPLDTEIAIEYRGLGKFSVQFHAKTAP